MKITLTLTTSSVPAFAVLLTASALLSATASAGYAQSSMSSSKTFVAASLDLTDHSAGDLASGTDRGASLPDSPDATMTVADQTQQSVDTPSKRILGIVPNFRAVGVGAQLPPQTVGNKFHTAFSDTGDPSSFILAGLLAGYNDARRSTPEFHGGAVAYGRYYWHSLADQTIENTLVEFIVPSIAHEDTRFYTLGGHDTGQRLKYALSRPFVTRSDAGKKKINVGELLGAAMSAAISSRYYPASQRDAGSILQAYGINVGIDAASFVLREFDSDINRMLSRKH